MDKPGFWGISADFCLHRRRRSNADDEMAAEQSFEPDFPLLEKRIKSWRREESDNAQLTRRFSLVAFPNLTSQNCRGNASFVATFSRILLIEKRWRWTQS